MDDGTGHLRRKDTTKGAPLRILSLDGGGVRGYSMLIILQELMHRTFVETEGRAPQRHEIPKPCDHFDLIAGTGTGGLIAIMLGRLRLDLDTCKDLYVRMTRRVFETDKTFAGIPLKGTMFKASKLEESIKEAVREHTIYESEGNDALGGAGDGRSSTSRNPGPQRTMSQSSRYSSMGQTPVASHGGGFSSATWRFGNPDALLYDQRETRTKTALTAVLQGTTRTEFLRSYDSRKEPAPDVNCTIWQAGRATSAAQMAFKPVRIGQSSYLDEGSGKYNPSPEVLDEATINEWPGREVGVFVSIGTGKRAKNTNTKDHEWWEGFLGGTMGGFAEARRKMIMKLEGCETTHEYMLQQHLQMRNVNTDNYYRFNVEVGVGEFGMNEWSRLSEISTNTRVYLSKAEVEAMTTGAASELAKSHFARVRQSRPGSGIEMGAQPLRNSWQSGRERPSAPPIPPPSNQFAVELPGDMTLMPPPSHYHNQRQSVADAKYTISSEGGYSGPPMQQGYPSRTASEHSMHQETLSPYQHHLHGNPSVRNSNEYYQTSSSQPPPRPPKTGGVTSVPTYYADNMTMSPTSPTSPNVYDHGGLRTFVNMGDPGRRLPYPDQKFADVDGPPPSVNMQSKPQM